MTDEPRTGRVSDLPPPNLTFERDELVRALGRAESSELVELRRRAEALQVENDQLRAQIAADGAVRDLLLRVEQLERSRRELLATAGRSGSLSARTPEPNAESDVEFVELASLFVAANQLHSSLVPRRVLRRLKEVLSQLVGARSYALYILSRDGREPGLVPIAWEGLTSPPPHASGEAGELAAVLRAGSARVCEGDPSQGSLAAPSAVLPLRLDEGPVGLVVIYATHAHKQAFGTLDFELFKLVGLHGAVALASAALYAGSHGRLLGPEAFSEFTT